MGDGGIPFHKDSAAVLVRLYPTFPCLAVSNMDFPLTTFTHRTRTRQLDKSQDWQSCGTPCGSWAAAAGLHVLLEQGCTPCPLHRAVLSTSIFVLSHIHSQVWVCC